MKEPELKLQTLLLSSNKGSKYITELLGTINVENPVPQKCNIAACDKIKANIRQGLETGNFYQLCVMLDVISHFAKFHGYKEGLPVLLEAGISKFVVKIFEKASQFESEVDEVHHKVSPELLMERVCETIADIGENCIKGKAIMVSSCTELLMELATDTRKTFKTRIEALKTLNPLLEGIENKAKEILQKTPETFKLMTSLAKMLHKAGDYEMQVSIIETLFRTTVKKDRHAFAKKWFHNVAESDEFAAIRDQCFETDCRKFLNIINSSMGDKQRVFSLPCASAYLGDIELHKPYDENLTEFWVDFNTRSQSVTMYVTVGDPDNSQQDGDVWETVNVPKSNLDHYSIHEMQDTTELDLTLSKPACELYVFLPNSDSTQLKLTFSAELPVHQVTAACFESEKLQGDRGKNSSKASVPADSTLMRNAKDDVSMNSITSRSSYQQSSDGHKVSVPSEIIITPRSKSAVKRNPPTTEPSSGKSAKCYKVSVSDSVPIEKASAKTPDRSKQRPSGRVKTTLQLVQVTDSSDSASGISSIPSHALQKVTSTMRSVESPSDKSFSSSTSAGFTFAEPLPKKNSASSAIEDKMNADTVEIVIPDSLPSPDKRIEESLETSVGNDEAENYLAGLEPTSGADHHGHPRSRNANSSKGSVASSSSLHILAQSPSLSTITEESLHTASLQGSQESYKANIKQLEAIQEEESMTQTEGASMDNREPQTNERKDGRMQQMKKKDTGAIVRKYSLRNRTKEVPVSISSAEEKVAKCSGRRMKGGVSSPQRNSDSQVSMYDLTDSPQVSQNTRKQKRTKSSNRSFEEHDSLEVSNTEEARSPRSGQARRGQARKGQARMAKQTKTTRGRKPKQGVRGSMEVGGTQSKRPIGMSRKERMKSSEYDFQDDTEETEEEEQNELRRENSQVSRHGCDDSQSDDAESQELEWPKRKQMQGKGRGGRKGKHVLLTSQESSQDDDTAEVENKGAWKGLRKAQGKKVVGASKTTKQKTQEISSQEEYSDVEIAREAVHVPASSVLKNRMMDDDFSFSRRDLRQKKPINYADAETSFEAEDTSSITKKSGKHRTKSHRSIFSDRDTTDSKSTKSDLSWLSEKKKPKTCTTYSRKTSYRKSMKLNSFSRDGLPQSDESDIEESAIDSVLKSCWDAPQKKRSFSSRHTDMDREMEIEDEDDRSSQYFNSANINKKGNRQKRTDKRSRKEAASSNDEEDILFNKTNMRNVLSSTLATPKLDSIKEREKTPRQRNRRYSPLDVHIMKTPVTPQVDNDIEEQDSDHEEEYQSSQNDIAMEETLLTREDAWAEEMIESEQEDQDEDEIDHNRISQTKSPFLPKSKPSGSRLSNKTKSDSLKYDTLRIKTPIVLHEKEYLEEQSTSEKSDNCFLKSGPSGKGRPRHSELKRKYKDIMSREDFDELFGSDSSQDVDQFEEQEEPSLKPKKLFRRELVEPAAADPIVDVEIPSSSEQTEEELNDSATTVAEEDEGSSVESFGVSKLLNDLSAEIKTAMKRRKSLVEKSMKTVVQTTKTQISTSLKTDSESRQKRFHNFKDSILQEMVGFERRLDQLSEVQTDFAELFKKYQRKFSTLLTHNQSSLERIRDMHASFNTEIEKQEESYQEQDHSIQQTMKKELKTMQKKILHDLQQKEIQRMKHALQMTLLSASSTH